MEKEIFFAAGCFWGTQRLMQSIEGVTDTQCGYANGTAENPSYEQVCRGDTGCRETVKVCYDPARVSLETLLKAYFLIVDPTVFNRQGNDVGSQYQTGIYYTEDASGEAVRKYAEAEALKRPVFAVEIGPLKHFYRAEEYHQNYLLKNPGGYCHISSLTIRSINEKLGLKGEKEHAVETEKTGKDGF